MNVFLKYIYRLSFLLLSLLILTVTISCKKSNSEHAERVIIKFSRGKDPTLGLNALVKGFNDSQEKITVVLDEMFGDTDEKHDKYVTQLASGNADFDIFEADIIWVAEFAQAGYVLPIDEFIKRDNIDLSKYLKNSIKSVTFEKKIWGFHNFTSSGILYYRKDIIKNPPVTWDDLIALSEKNITTSGVTNGYICQANRYEGLVCNLLEFIHAYGGSIIDESCNVMIDSSQSVDGFKTFINILHSNIVPEDISLYREEETDKNFLDGNSLFCRNWHYLWYILRESEDKDRYGIAMLPAGPHGSASTLGGWVGMINKSTKYPDEAWEFCKYMAGPDGQKIRAIHGGLIPTYTPLYEDPEVLNSIELLNIPAFVDSLNKTATRPVTPYYQDISMILQLETYKVINKEQTVEEAVKKIEQSITEILAEKK